MRQPRSRFDGWAVGYWDYLSRNPMTGRRYTDPDDQFRCFGIKASQEEAEALRESIVKSKPREFL